MTPASSEDDYVASEASSSGGELESETLADLEQMHAKLATTTNKTKSTKYPIPASAKKKTPPKKKKDVTTTDDSEKKCSTSFSPEELLLVAKAFMKVSSNAKHGTDKKM